MNLVPRRVLLINPAKRGTAHLVDRLHLGLTLLSQKLVEAGHIVQVVDYSFLRVLHRFPIPPIERLVSDFAPDVVGISSFTYLYDETIALIDAVARLTAAPIMVGGPHATLFPEDFMAHPGVSYVVTGEADAIIADLVAGARRSDRPLLVTGPPPDASLIPVSDLDHALGSEHLRTYQIQLSRGCPFSCSFCNVRQIAGGQRVRARDITTCVDQIARALQRYPGITTIAVTDDCPNYDTKRFNEFLKLLAERTPRRQLVVDNVRADLIDDTMLENFKAAGGQGICIGVESGNADVFAQTHKGESLPQIAAAATMIKQHGLQLGLCFVIGLPGDSPQRHRESVALAHRLNPDFLYWNMCLPWPRTEVSDWFLAHGTIDDPRGRNTLIDSYFHYTAPVAWTPEFDRDQRVRAWFTANLATFALPVVLYRPLPANLLRLWRTGWRYGFAVDVVCYWLLLVPRWLHRKLMIRGGRAARG